MKTKMKTLDDIIELISDSKEALTLEELVEIHKRLVEASKLGNIIKAHILNALVSGQSIVGYKLVKTRGRAGITDSKEATRRIMEYYKEAQGITADICDVLEPTSLDSLRKLLSPGVVTELLSGLISSGGDGKSYDYAPIDDEREEVKP